LLFGISLLWGKKQLDSYVDRGKKPSKITNFFVCRVFVNVIINYVFPSYADFKNISIVCVFFSSKTYKFFQKGWYNGFAPDFYPFNCQRGWSNLWYIYIYFWVQRINININQFFVLRFSLSFKSSLFLTAFFTSHFQNMVLIFSQN